MPSGSRLNDKRVVEVLRGVRVDRVGEKPAQVDPIARIGRGRVVRLEALPGATLHEQALQDVLDPLGGAERPLDPGASAARVHDGEISRADVTEPLRVEDERHPGREVGLADDEPSRACRPRPPRCPPSPQPTENAGDPRCGARQRARSWPERREEASHERRSDLGAGAGRNPVRAALAPAHVHRRRGGTGARLAALPDRQDAGAADAGRIRARRHARRRGGSMRRRSPPRCAVPRWSSCPKRSSSGPTRSSSSERCRRSAGRRTG